MICRGGGGGVLLPVDEPPPHAPLEEAAATIAGVDAVVFPAAGVSAHFADQSWAQSLSRAWTLGCKSKRVNGAVSYRGLSQALLGACACHLHMTSAAPQLHV